MATRPRLAFQAKAMVKKSICILQQNVYVLFICGIVCGGKNSPKEARVFYKNKGPLTERQGLSQIDRASHRDAGPLTERQGFFREAMSPK